MTSEVDGVLILLNTLGGDVEAGAGDRGNDRILKANQRSLWFWEEATPSADRLQFPQIILLLCRVEQ